MLALPLCFLAIIENMKRMIFFAVCLSLLSCKEGREQSSVYIKKSYIMSVPMEVRIYSAEEQRASSIASRLLNEAKRISDEFSYNEQYSQTSYVNKNAYEKWVPVEKEFLTLLHISKYYYDLTGGGFDPTFAPLWPIWKEAASRRKMPSKEEIGKAISRIGYANVMVDKQNSMVKFIKPLELNFGGVLRGYAFYKIIELLEKEGISDKLELDIGANKLCWGEGDWEYAVSSPFNEKQTLGVLKFPAGVIVSSSGRSHFVEIEGKLYSHILNIKTGYPIENFSNLIVYLPQIKENFISSAALAILGKEKAFEIVSAQKGACAVWIDGSGAISYFAAPDSPCRWEKPKKFKFF
ncbi:MAG: FAD:protein FMN transferase [Elusimicrobiota bacterium]